LKFFGEFVSVDSVLFGLVGHLVAIALDRPCLRLNVDAFLSVACTETGDFESDRLEFALSNWELADALSSVVEIHYLNAPLVDHPQRRGQLWLT
jgi:hypothetical protein